MVVSKRSSELGSYSSRMCVLSLVEMATGVGMATELYRVLVTGIPAGVHKEVAT